jgi:serine/threonine-protein kinase
MASRQSMDAAQLIGRTIDGRYKILEAMASGSMGAVYKAERVPVGKLVAIKFLHAAFANDSEFLIRFEREIGVMSKLAHPNCVSVVDFGVYEGAPYLVMDYVAGRTLRTVLDDEPMGPMRALALVRQIASGLAHAHAQGIVHRDIKPANIMITDETGVGEHARILDFGLARLRNQVGRDATQHNMVVGTPNYMAPEQTVGGGTIDARTDVYAVGVVLFEMIAGDRPYQAEDTLALLGMHRAAPIPKLADRLDRTIVIPKGLQGVIEKALAKSPDDRYQTAIELAEAIDEVTGAKVMPDPSGEVVHRKKAATPSSGSRLETDAAVASTIIEKTSKAVKQLPPPKSNTTLIGIVVAILVLAGGAFGAWYVFGRGGDEKPVADAAVAAPPPAPDAAAPPDATAATADVAAPVIADAQPDVDAAGPDAAEPDAGAGSNTEIEMEPDPVTAENLAPKTDSDSEDEAPDAPATDADVEKKAPPAPVLARNTEEAVRLIKEGKSELALSSLRALWKKSPNSGYIPFLLGNIYFDKSWWSIAMDHYRIAITKSGGYRQNSTLNRNIIRMLASTKTRAKADAFIRRTIGKPAVPYLRQAAANEKNAAVRTYAGRLAGSIR